MTEPHPDNPFECPKCAYNLARIREHERRVEAMAVDLGNLQVDLLAKNRVIGQLRNELEVAKDKDAGSKEIREVATYWMTRLEKRKGTKVPMSGKRAANVRKLLRQGYTVDQLKRAIDGCALKPFVGHRGRQATSEGGAKRYDDLELICRDETTVERFIRIAEEHGVGSDGTFEF